MAKQKKRWSTPRKIITWVVSIVVVLAVILGAAGGYFSTSPRCVRRRTLSVVGC